MLEDNPFTPRVITCLTHRREKATHICTDLNCHNSPILCPYCLSDPRIRSSHNHESSVQWFTELIRSQSKPIQLIYERTIGSRECEVIKFNLEKGSLLTQQVQNRLQSLKMQLQIEMEMLMKEFQKQLQLQKQEFQKRLEEYHRNYNLNLEVLKRDSTELLAFQHSLKYYNNANSFTLKLITESQRKSQQWIVTQKRVLQRVNYILQNPSFVSAAMNIFTRANKSNLFILPAWRGDRREKNQSERDIRGLVRTAIGNWIDIPQITDLQVGKNYQYSINKYIVYPIYV